MVRYAFLLIVLTWTTAGHAQQALFAPGKKLRVSEPELQLGRNSVALPVVEYRAPDGVIRISQGIIVGRDISPNARIGIGMFKMKPKYDELSRLPTGNRSRKLALGFSLKF